jgi:hypothetical protein
LWEEFWEGERRDKNGRRERKAREDEVLEAIWEDRMPQIALICFSFFKECFKLLRCAS